MARTECLDCFRLLDARSMAKCGRCERVICPQCADQNDGLCQECTQD